MMDIIKVIEKLENEKELLDELAEKHGLNDCRVMEQSKKVDKLVVHYMKLFDEFSIKSKIG